MFKRGWSFIVISMVLAGLIGACTPGGTTRTVTKGDEIANYNFTLPGTWEEGAYSGATLRVIDGVYRIDVTDGTGTLWWGQWGDSQRDVIIDVDTEQTTERPETAYGVMCRVRGRVGQNITPDPTLAAIVNQPTPTLQSTAEVTDAATAEATSATDATAEATDAAVSATAEATDAALVPTVASTIIAAATDEPPLDENTIPALLEGDGYLFLIQGTGAGGIFRASGRNLHTLADWRTNPAIEVAPSRNHIRAACVGNYFALWVNDVLIAEANDDTYAEGQIGMVASAANRLGVRVQFDNLQISAVQGS